MDDARAEWMLCLLTLMLPFFVAVAFVVFVSAP